MGLRECEIDIKQQEGEFMKRGVVVIFLLLTTMVFAEDSQIDETRELRERVVKLEAVIERMEKEQNSSTNYYKEALQDSKEIYKGAVENNDKMLNHVYWAISGVFALLTAFLALIKWDNNKRLEKEKEEIKKDNDLALKGLRVENKSLLDGVTSMQEEIKKLEEKLQNSFEKEIEKHRELVEKENKELKEKIDKIDKQTEEIREKHIETKINAGIIQALSKKTDEEKYEALKKIEEEVKGFDEKYKENLYFQIACYINESNINEKIKYYNKAINLNDKEPSYYNNRGVTYHKIGDWEKALKDFEEAINLNGSISTLYCNRAELYIEKDQLDDAFEDLIKNITRGNEGEFNLELSKEKYNKFLKFIEDKPNRTGLENEVLRKFEKEEGIKII